MNAVELYCPICGKSFTLSSQREHLSIFCPYCGEKFVMHESFQTVPPVCSVRIEKNITHVKKTTNDAEVIRATADLIRAKNKHKEESLQAILGIFVFVLSIVLLFCIFLFSLFQEKNMNRKNNTKSAKE